MYKIILLGFCSVSLYLYTMDEDAWSIGLPTPPLSHEPGHTPPPTGGIDDFGTWSSEEDPLFGGDLGGVLTAGAFHTDDEDQPDLIENWQAEDELAFLMTQQVHLQAEHARLKRAADSADAAKAAEQLLVCEAELAKVTSSIKVLASYTA